MKRIKAFTIIELLVTMVISAIVVVLAFQGLNWTKSQHLNYQTKVSNQLEIQQLYGQLKLAFQDATEISITNNELKCKYKNGADKYWEFGYERAPAFISNENNSIIFEPIKVTDLHTYFEDEVRYVGLIDKMKLDVEFEGKTVVWEFNKQYDAQTLLDLAN